MNDILYSKVSSLKDRLEIDSNYTKKQIEEAVKLVNQINTIFDMKILTCYSARYYGARGGRGGRKKKIEVGESNAIK